MIIQMVHHWVKAFDEGYTEVPDALYLGRLSDTVNENWITTLCAMFKEDWQVTISVLQWELVDEQFMYVHLTRYSAHYCTQWIRSVKIVGTLGVKELDWRTPKRENKTALELSMLYHHEGDALFNRIVTSDNAGFIHTRPKQKNNQKNGFPWGLSPWKNSKKNVLGRRSLILFFGTLKASSLSNFNLTMFLRPHTML